MKNKIVYLFTLICLMAVPTIAQSTTGVKKVTEPDYEVLKMERAALFAEDYKGKTLRFEKIQIGAKIEKYTSLAKNDIYSITVHTPAGNIFGGMFHQDQELNIVLNPERAKILFDVYEENRAKSTSTYTVNMNCKVVIHVVPKGAFKICEVRKIEFLDRYSAVIRVIN
jgi:hypothetical protein